MAIFRKIHVSFWEDRYVEDLTPEGRYFYMFLLTNPCVKACGIYEITMRKMVFFTGYNSETVSKLMQKFIDDGKIKYDKSHSEVLICNWAKFNLKRGGTPMLDCLKSELQSVHNQDFIEEMIPTIEVDSIRDVYVTSTLRTTLRGQEKEKEKEKEEDIKDVTPTVSSDVTSTSIPDKSDTKKRKLKIPTIQEVIEYFRTNGFSPELATKAFNYYSVANWKDSEGKSVINWKQKMQGVWFKTENKIQTTSQKSRLSA